MDSIDAASHQIFAGLRGPELSVSDQRALSDLQPAGLTLFARNLRSAAQVRDLIAGIREIVRQPVLLAIDQEGGKVNRLTQVDSLFEQLPTGRLQAAWTPERMRQVWTQVGECLASLGFDIDFAPVVDLDDGPGTNAIGPRSYGGEPERVVAQADALMKGLAASGVAACLKHFPGLGATEIDTHRALSTSPAGEEELWERHLLPFRQLHERAALIMTSHAHYPAVDGPEPLPGTFSPRLVRGWLRERIGFEGLIVTDDLGMGALGQTASPGEKARRALDAGADLLLYCQDLDAPRHARDVLAQRLLRGEMDDEAMGQARVRVRSLLASYPGGRRPQRLPWQEACVRMRDVLLG